MYIRNTNMAYIHTLKYFFNMLFLVAALTESLFKCIILDVSPQFSNFIFFIHSIFKKYVVQSQNAIRISERLSPVPIFFFSNPA